MLTTLRLWLAVIRDGYRPFQVVAVGARGALLSRSCKIAVQWTVVPRPTSATRPLQGAPCRAPVTEPDALRTLLENRVQSSIS
jgi:hypothetical protein